jgi:putative transposase of IS4/5 family DUF4096
VGCLTCEDGVPGLVWAVREGCEPAKTKKTTRKPWEIEDGLWKRIEPLLPVVERTDGRPGRKRLENRKVMCGILFVLYTGIDLLTGGQVAHPHRPILAPGDGDQAAVRHPCRHRQHRVGAGQGFADLLAGGQIPHPAPPGRHPRRQQWAYRSHCRTWCRPA